MSHEQKRFDNFFQLIDFLLELNNSNNLEGVLSYILEELIKRNINPFYIKNLNMDDIINFKITEKNFTISIPLVKIFKNDLSIINYVLFPTMITPENYGEELPNEFVLKYIINKNHIFNLNRISFIYEFDRLEYNNNDDKILEKIKILLFILYKQLVI